MRPRARTHTRAHIKTVQIKFIGQLSLYVIVHQKVSRVLFTSFQTSPERYVSTHGEN